MSALKEIITPSGGTHNPGCVVTNDNYRRYRIGHLTSKVRVAGLRQLTLVTPFGQPPYWLLELPWLKAGQAINLGEVNQLPPNAAKSLARRLLKGPKKSPEDGLTLKKLVWLYRKLHALHLSPGRQASIKSYSQRLIEVFGNEPVTWITGPMVRRWHADYSQKSPGAADESKNLLRTLINCAKKWDLIPVDHSNPCLGIRRNRRGHGHRSLNRGELQSLGAALDKDEASMRYRSHARRIRMTLFTGARPGEIRKLCWSHVIFDGDIPSHLQIPRSKTGPRRIDLNSAAREVLLAQRFSRKINAGAAVFPNAEGSKRCYSEEQAKNYWRGLSERAGLSLDSRQYWLRHTFGTNSILAGGTLATAGALLGHSEPSTTQHYLHIPPEHVLAAGTLISNRIAAWMELPVEPSTVVSPIAEIAPIRTLTLTEALVERTARAKAESDVRRQQVKALFQALRTKPRTPPPAAGVYKTKEPLK